MSSELSDEVDDLRRRVERLEAAASAAPTMPTDDPANAFWALDGLKSRAPETGAVLYTGSVILPGGVQADWQYALTTDAILAKEWSAPSTAASLAALGSPVRLRLLQAIANGATSVADLADLDGLGTTGQVYHHVNQLMATGWVHSTSRGHYGIPPERAVPLLAILLALGGAA